MKQDIALYSQLANPIEAIDRIGEMFARSGMFGCDRPEQGKVLAMVCLAERKSPVEITRTYDIVEGKLRKKALAALAEFRSKGGKHTWLRSGDEPAADEASQRATLALEAPDGSKVEYSYSIADARAEGLIRDKSRWVKRPGNMLRARCISNGLGMLMPEIYAGEDESEPMPAPALDLATTTTTPPPEPKPAKVVTLEVVAEPPAPAPEPTPELPAVVATPEPPAPAPAPEPPKEKEFKPGPSYASPPNGGLPSELVKELEDAIGDHGPQAIAWMLKEGWLQKGQDLSALPEARARRVIKQRDSFLRAIGGAK